MIDSGTLHYYGGIIWHMGLGTYEWQMGFVAQGILFWGEFFRHIFTLWLYALICS